MRQIFINLLGFIVLIILIALLATPYLLVILFPTSGESVAAVARVVVPWMVVMFLALVFNEQLKWVITSVGDLIKRTKKVGPGGLDTQQDADGLHFTKEQADQLRSEFGKIQQEKNDMLQGLIYYYHRFLFLTIYRSQIEMLQFLAGANAAIPQKQLRVFYDAALSRKPSLKQYAFERYLGFLKDNFLINILPNGDVDITPAAKGFLQELNSQGVSVESLPE